MHLSAQKIIDHCAAILNNSVNFERDTMPDPSENGFIVVECQTAPNQNNNNKHVCVPKTWVKCKISEKKGRVAIAYPADDDNSIVTRIKNKEPADDRWQYYFGDIKYEADSYEDAVDGFLQIPREENVEPVAEQKESLKMRIVLSKTKSKSDKKKKSEKKALKKHLKEHSKDKNKKSKHKNVQKHSLKENIPDSGYISGMTTPSDSVDNQEATELSSPFVPNSNCQSNGLPKSLESKMDDIINSAPQSYVKQITNNLNNNNKSDLFERTLESLAAVMEKEIDFTNANISPKDKQLLIDAQMKTNGIFKYIKQVMEGVRKMYIEAQETKKTLDHIVSKYKVQPPPTTVLEEKENDLNDQQNGNSFQEETLQHEMETETDDGMENETNAIEQNDNTLIIKEGNLFGEQDTEMDNKSDNEIFTDDESTTNEQSTPSSSHDVYKDIKKYDKKNTTWTLKHPHPGKGLVQLGGRDTHIYISAKGLEKAKQTSDTVKVFTRHLFREVFTQKALQTCSMTGKRPHYGRKDVIRPALHNHARTVIFTYAMKYGREVGWESIRLSELVKNLRIMLQNSRRHKKNGRTIRY